MASDRIAELVGAWRASAVADAERRGLPELRPLLEGLAHSLAALRTADREYEAERNAAAPGPASDMHDDRS